MYKNTLPQGVFKAHKKDGTSYYRASITYNGKHISLGSFCDACHAGNAYNEGRRILDDSTVSIEDFNNSYNISFDKWVCLINFRDNGIYIKNPIYIFPGYFEYYYSRDFVYKFDVDDLFFYSHHKIMKRNGHLFTADYGMQVNILSRYGIHRHSVCGRDYVFINGDSMDFRYKNIKVINKYMGVYKSSCKGRNIFTAKIHVNGDLIIGRYYSEAEAAAAYNKAADILREKGLKIAFTENFVEELTPIQYAAVYNSVKISKRILTYKCK